MGEPIYCTRCGRDIEDGCSCEECMGPGPYCDVTGQVNCDCQYCAPAIDYEPPSWRDPINERDERECELLDRAQLGPQEDREE